MIKPFAFTVIALLSFVPAQASSTLFQQFTARALPDPIQILTTVEQRYQQHGQIIEFELEVEDGQILYEVELVKGQQLVELLLDSKGQLLEQDFDLADIDDEPELRALAVLEQQQGQFSHYVKKAIGQQAGYLLEAQLEHNIGISYLEVELLTERGKRKLALDLTTEQPLPILNWF